MDDDFREPRRARRRRDLQRMKAKARRIFPGCTGIVKLANHLAFCSRICCANPRRMFREVTMAERRADLAFSDDPEF
ncbi:heterodisulfide reductase subunit A-like polyferredoxin [Skermanella aerolata]|uniref:hypothetical protein n=1 Tax=Skermanella aerolata TaxID=393310 RepID=UPI003D2190CC